MSGPVDEFAWIASLRSLTRGDAASLNLTDDAAVVASRPGHDLVISKDAMVEGVHFPVREGADIIARRLLRVGLSDLAAKAAAPFGYFLMTAWPPDRGEADREAFRRGLYDDGREFSVALLGGDTVSTSGPLVVSATVLGWVPSGRAVLRSGARAGDALVICGSVGDGWLGLQAVQGWALDPTGHLAGRYRLPTPLLAIREVLAEHARAAADVSDGLLADAAHVADASGLGFSLELDDIPISPQAGAWLEGQGDDVAGRLGLATGGDDYAIVCAVDPAQQGSFIASVQAFGVPAGRAGTFEDRVGMRITAGGQPVQVGATGWRHS